MVRPLLVKEHGVSGFNGDFHVEVRHGGGREKVFKNAELEIFHENCCQSRRIDTIIGATPQINFKMSQRHGDSSEARKLGTVRVDTERC